MNGKKIVLLTTLIAFLVLITFTAVFARFVLNIDLKGEGSSSIVISDQKDEKNEAPDDSEPAAEEEKKQESADKDKQGMAEQDKKDLSDKEAADKDKKESKEQKDTEEKAFETKSKIKTAALTIEGEESYKLDIKEEEKLEKLLQGLQALKPMSVAQSVGLQDAKWKTSMNLSMADGTAISVKLYESTLSGSKTTLSTGAETYESTEPLTNIKALLESWVEEDRKANAPDIAADEFAQASRVLTIDPFSMEVQDVAASKSSIQAALGGLKVVETLSGNINPGVEYTGTNRINLADATNTLFTLEFYKTGILAYRSESSKEFYVCETDSLKTFYQTIEQICSQYAATPEQLALMDFGAFNSASVSNTTGTSRKEVGLIRDHAQNLFYFIQQLHVKKGSMKEESAMFKRPEYHVDLEFDSGAVMGIDINKGSLLIDIGDGSISHYTLIGDSNLELVRAELERVTSDD